MDERMTATEMVRLSDWLKSKGMTAEETIDCLHYIANSTEATKNESQTP